RLLFVGDIVGRPGRRFLEKRLPGLKAELQVDLVVVNGENAAGGVGITERIGHELFRSGVDAITLGNHTWDKPEGLPLLDHPHVVRPLNVAPGLPGKGSTVIRKDGLPPVAVLNVMGRVFMGLLLDDPFRRLDQALAEIPGDVKIRLVDVHAEATSEKLALGFYLDGRVSAVVGTHTHVQTHDAVLLPKGTAYLTDAGMTGPWPSVIGIQSQQIIQRFLTQTPIRFEVAEEKAQLAAALIEVDQETGKALSIRPILEREEEE
ncbi:MAG: TIGR00282 family metallophosphoesterase, partial [Bacillota bacterium]|nr:TIGR00282 family metallophosphoesterase [Bacillota bacterium]